MYLIWYKLLRDLKFTLVFFFLLICIPIKIYLLLSVICLLSFIDIYALTHIAKEMPFKSQHIMLDTKCQYLNKWKVLLYIEMPRLNTPSFMWEFVCTYLHSVFIHTCKCAYKYAYTATLFHFEWQVNLWKYLRTKFCSAFHSVNIDLENKFHNFCRKTNLLLENAYKFFDIFWLN